MVGEDAFFPEGGARRGSLPLLLLKVTRMGIAGLINTFLKSLSVKIIYDRVTIGRNPDLKPKITQALETFAGNPYHPYLRTHKLSGKLRGLWAFVVAYDCRIVFQFLDEQNVLLIDIGKHDEVYWTFS